MPSNKNLFILLGFLVAVGAFIYKFEKREPITKTVPEKNQIAIKNEIKSSCKEQLDSQPIEPIEKFEGTPKAVNFETNTLAKTYYTRITEDVTSGPNFAGHFTVAKWGCGTDCYGYSVIDTKSGEIINFDPVNEGYHVEGFSLTGRFLILEPVFAGTARKFYKIVEAQGGKSRLELVCSELAAGDMFEFSKIP